MKRTNISTEIMQQVEEVRRLNVIARGQKGYEILANIVQASETIKTDFCELDD